MTKKIKCQNSPEAGIKKIRVKILKAPFVDSSILKQIIQERDRALVI